MAVEMRDEFLVLSVEALIEVMTILTWVRSNSAMTRRLCASKWGWSCSGFQPITAEVLAMILLAMSTSICVFFPEA